MGKISPEEAKRATIAALLRAQVPITKIAEQEKVSRPTIYAVKRRLESGDFSRKKRVNPPNPKLTPEALEDIKSSFEANSTTSIRKMAKFKDMSEGTVRNALKKTWYAVQSETSKTAIDRGAEGTKGRKGVQVTQLD